MSNPTGCPCGCGAQSKDPCWNLSRWEISEVDLPPGACPGCGGEGQVSFITGPGPEDVASATCPSCNGTGDAKPTTCPCGIHRADCEYHR